MATSLEKQLLNVIKDNTEVFEVIKLAETLNLPNWYVGAGSITQSVWNRLHDFPISQNILDIDVVFFDPERLSSEYEEEIRNEIKVKMSGLPSTIFIYCRSACNMVDSLMCQIKVKDHGDKNEFTCSISCHQYDDWL